MRQARPRDGDGRRSRPSGRTTLPADEGDRRRHGAESSSLIAPIARAACRATLANMPSRNARWIIGIIFVAVIAHGVQKAGIRDEIRGLRADIRAILADVRALDDRVTTDIAKLRAEMAGRRADVTAQIRALDDRLRAVEIAFGKVDQRLLTLERVFLPAQPPE